MEQDMRSEQQKEELERFQSILALLRNRLSKAKEDREQKLAGLNDVRRDEFTERQEPLLRNLWASNRFEDLVHLSQEFQNAAEEEKDQESALQLISALQKTAASPYFARIDLQFDPDEPAEKVYIGRHSLWDDAKDSLLIYDWRAPMASVFYRFGAGPAWYQAPMGKITCDLLLKRQFEIQDGKLLGFFDADTVIQDSFLRRLLAQNASAQMKSIVETIQKDQDEAIRDEDHDLLMVQGAAGSGKTSIAMHRAAYLMYEGLKNPLKAHNILILSPNAVFEKYISGVLPELGESSVRTATLEELLEDKLEMPVQSRADRWEALCGQTEKEAAARKLVFAFKTSRAFLTLLDRYAEALPRLLPYADLDYAGKLFSSRQEQRAWAMEHGGSFPLAVRLKRLEAHLWERAHAMRPARFNELRMKAFHLDRGEEWARGFSIWESGVLARQMRKITRLDIPALYAKLLNDPSLLRALGQDLPIPSGLRWDQAPEAPLPLEDAAAIAYLQMKLQFGGASGDIRQVVVDEAQDYGPADWAVLKLLFPKARFTVVGDIYQALERQADLSLYADIASMLKPGRSALLELSKSFRCTKEILEFSLQFLPGANIRSLNRSGSVPKCLTNDGLLSEIAACRKEGYQSIALIAKTRRDAEAWQARMEKNIHLPILGRNAQLGDVFLSPLSLSKGLEFDAVLLLDCDAAHYGRPGDERLLYVGCTRALHRLALFAENEFSPLIQRRDRDA